MTTAADKERRGDANFVKGGRSVRDAVRRQRTAETFDQLDKTARICAQASARKRELNRGTSDPAQRRKDRRARTRELLAEYRHAVAPLLEWFEKIERERDPSACSPLLAQLEREAR